MPSFCVVSNCELKYTHSENVSFHKFPLNDESLLQKWIEFTDRGAHWKPSRWSSICSRHFVASDFREFLSRKCLKKTSIPSIVTKNNVSYETYHIGEQSLTANSLYDDDGSESALDVHVLRNKCERIAITRCRLCGERNDESVKTVGNIEIDEQEICEMLRKCLPSISIARHNHLNLVCQDCISHLRRYCDFIDKVLSFQRNSDVSKSVVTISEHILKANITNFEARGNTSSSNALFIKQEPINVKQEILDSSNRKPHEAIINTVMKSTVVPSIPTSITHTTSRQSLIHWPRNYTNTFCQYCERIFINNAEMKSHLCTGGQHPHTDREATNNTGTNNCEIMEIITLNNPPVSFIDLAEDECANAEQIPVCKKESVTDVERQERVDIEHAYAKRPTMVNTTTSNACNLKQEIEVNYDCELSENTIFGSDEIAVPPARESVHPAKQDIFICSKCDQEFNTDRLLVDHSNKMHSLKNRICVICSAEFKSTYEYLLHKNKAHMSGYQCQFCKRKFSTRISMKNHERHSCSIDSIDYFYSCRHCGKSMRNRIRMKEHLKICASNPNAVVKAVAPKYNNCADGQNTIQACNIIASKKAFSCHRCHRSFKKESNFKRHTVANCMLKHPGNDSTKIVASRQHSTDVLDVNCKAVVTECANDKNGNESMNNANNNNNNNNNGHPCGKYVCELCKKQFHAYANLKQHRTTHENEKKIICVMCPKKFKRISGLNQHVRGFHYKIKPFSCPICNYAYALKGDMLRCRHSWLKKDAASFAIAKH